MIKHYTKTSIAAAATVAALLLTGCSDNGDDECQDDIENSAAYSSLPDQMAEKVGGSSGGRGGSSGGKGGSSGSTSGGKTSKNKLSGNGTNKGGSSGGKSVKLKVDAEDCD